MNWAALGLLVVSSAALADEDKPLLVASVHVVPFSAFPDLLGGGVTVHLIPYVDVEGGVGGLPSGFSWFVRAGPRYQFIDARNDAGVGFTGRVSARFGYKQLKTTLAPDTQGFNFAGCLDLTYFVAKHLGFGGHLSGGGVYEVRPNTVDEPARKRVVPELRLALTVTF